MRRAKRMVAVVTSAVLTAGLLAGSPTGAQAERPDSPDRPLLQASDGHITPLPAGVSDRSMFVDGPPAPTQGPSWHAAADGWIDLGFGAQGPWEARFTPSAASLRPALTTVAGQLASEVGFTLAMGTVTTSRRFPEAGELLVVVSSDLSDSGCEGAAPGEWAGCGDAFSYPEDPATAVAGRIIIHPRAVGYGAWDQESLLAHEVGHTIGLAHLTTRYQDAIQVMHPDSLSYHARRLRAGDVNGARVQRARGDSPAPEPGTTAEPGAPAGLALRRRNQAISVGWAPPLWDGTSSVLDYEVETVVGSAAATFRTVTATSVALTGLANGTPVRVRVRARNTSGYGPWTGAQTVTPRPLAGPFGSMDAALTWLYQNVLLIPRDTEVDQFWHYTLAGGDYDSTDLFIDAALTYDYFRSLSSVFRLYRAYFRRAPDQSGLDFWGERMWRGGQLAHVSSAFAASPEFRSTYGSLSNGQFVDLVYRNVLGRSPDAAGRSYWVGRLNAGTTRGRVMIGFSEAIEHMAKTDLERLCSLLPRALLGALPPPAEVTACVTALRTGTMSVYDVTDMILYDPDFGP